MVTSKHCPHVLMSIIGISGNKESLHDQHHATGTQQLDTAPKSKRKKKKNKKKKSEKTEVNATDEYSDNGSYMNNNYSSDKSTLGSDNELD